MLYFSTPFPDFIGAPVENSPSAALATAVTKTGSIFSVQRCSPDPAHVCVCTACSLDGLCLVYHWTQGDRKR